MADSTFQIAAKPKLYLSYPLKQYASGNQGSHNSTGDVDTTGPREHYRLLNLDPADNFVAGVATYGFYHDLCGNYSGQPSGEKKIMREGQWDFDYLMILGHNFKTKNFGVDVTTKNYISDSQSTWEDVNLTPLVNDCYNTTPEYNGWSLMGIDYSTDDPERTLMRIDFNSQDETATGEVSIGSILWGKSYTFPINTTLNTTVKFDYGVKQSQTTFGKTISRLKWSKPQSWLNGRIEPFGLIDTYPDDSLWEQYTGDDHLRKSGRRTWTMEFDGLIPSQVMNQNMMLNDNNFVVADNQEAGAATNSSLYNVYNGVDFYRVVNTLMGSHLPCVLQLDSTNYSPSNFAIVRMNDYTITQKSPNLYTIKCSFTEQI